MNPNAQQLERVADENKPWILSLDNVNEVGVYHTHGGDYIKIGATKPLSPADQQKIAEKLQGHDFKIEIQDLFPL